ncbi:856_t:CDS:2 [Acaulospora morrowiae]|uniref:856_t:CDS:1 n=1 Tax=Acaulospora morrowiae TaxID=94023 RepID=A0A9N9GKH1_9GLOM|nr:856_t:CDS:2 [Acaulospora morrowiae]
MSRWASAKRPLGRFSRDLTSELPDDYRVNSLPYYVSHIHGLNGTRVVEASHSFQHFLIPLGPKSIDLFIRRSMKVTPTRDPKNQR